MNSATTPGHKMSLAVVSRMTEDECRAFIERCRWPQGANCPHCGSVSVGTIKANPAAEVRAGLYKCRDCRRQFTVTVNTVMHRSKISMKTWLMAFTLMCASKKGVSSLQMQRMLGIGSYKTAWFLTHRIREAMGHGGLTAPAKLDGDVEADETYVGGKPRYKGVSKCGNGTSKIPVVGLVQRGGDVRTRVIANINGENLKAAVRDFASPTARLHTDQSPIYRGVEKLVASHDTVNHSKGEYVRGGAGTQAIESFWSLLKRSIVGAWHNVSPEHLGRYLTEREFTWNTREITDGERTVRAILGVGDKRLTYKGLAA